jgi:hypothetical protein
MFHPVCCIPRHLVSDRWLSQQFVCYSSAPPVKDKDKKKLTIAIREVHPVPVQMWQGVSPVPVQTWQG